MDRENTKVGLEQFTRNGYEDRRAFASSHVDLYDGSSENLIYSCDLEQIPEDAGIYVFARCFGEVSLSAFCKEKAQSVRGRIKQQLNNTKLMKGIENSKIGPRVLLPAEVSTWVGSHLLRPGYRGADADRALPVRGIRFD